jgi:pSer/pThr/pTyr-binding forkhead associated (FHA) protein
LKSPIIFRVFKNNQIQFVKQFVDKDQIVIGQLVQVEGESQIDIQLDSNEVSAIHCLFEKRGTEYYVCDLGSAQGTFKNGTQVVDDKVGPGDEIQVGPFKIVFLTMPALAGVTPSVPAPQATPTHVAPITPVTPVVVATPPPPVGKTVDPKVEAPKIQVKPAAPVQPKVEPVKPPVITSTTFSTPKALSKGVSSFKSKTSKHQKTYAPASAHNNLSEFIRSGKGDTVQVITSWKGRVLDTVSYKAEGSYKAGTAQSIQLPQGTVSADIVLLDCTAGVSINIPGGASAEVKRDNEVSALSDSRHKLQQNEVVYINFKNGIQVGIRYAPQSSAVTMESPIMLGSSELTGLLCALILAALTSLIVSVYTPKDTKQDEEVQRVAQVIFNKPPPPLPKPVEITTPVEKVEVKPEEKKPEEKKPVKMAKASEVEQNKGDVTKPDAKAQAASKAGRANEVKPKDPKLKTKMFTSTKQGGAVKTGETAGANAQSKEKDATNSGLLAAFGSGGARSKLDKAYNGSGELLGAGEKATGSSGFNENRAGDDLGSKFKDTGAGGKGTATQGIAGVGTKGRGNGMSAYGSGDGFGAKDQVAIQAGGAEEEFVGSIDKEAVRRAVKSAMSAFRACYERELKSDSKLEGKVVIAWEIHEKGVGRNSKVVKDKSTIGNSAVENCVRDRVLAIRYPEPPPGTVAEVVYPFLFSAQK